MPHHIPQDIADRALRDSDAKGQRNREELHGRGKAKTRKPHRILKRSLSSWNEAVGLGLLEDAEVFGEASQHLGQRQESSLTT